MVPEVLARLNGRAKPSALADGALRPHPFTTAHVTARCFAGRRAIDVVDAAPAIASDKNLAATFAGLAPVQFLGGWDFAHNFLHSARASSIIAQTDGQAIM
jgi:hypothetical protein